MNAVSPPLYVSHKGTIKVAGGTDCRRAFRCALFFLQKGSTPVDFFFLGANAGQQALKAMGLLRSTIESITENKSTVVFQPNHVTTIVATDQGQITKDATFWRAFIVNNVAFNSAVIQPEIKAADLDALPPSLT